MRGLAPLGSVLALVLGLLPGCRASRNGIEDCVPGETLDVGCAVSCGGLGSCRGDPRLRICDGPAGTDLCEDGVSGALITEVDDSSCGGSCPHTTVVCPESGSIAVVVAGECDWAVEHRGIVEPGGVETCTPGAALELGCAEGCGLGACTGDPVLKVCDGSRVSTIADCLAQPDGTTDIVLGRNDDSTCGSRCSFLSFTCPASGRIVIAHRPFSSGSAYTCDWAIRSP